MTAPKLTLQEVKNRDDLMAFIRFPWKIYQGIPIGSRLSLKTNFRNSARNLPSAPMQR